MMMALKGIRYELWDVQPHGNDSLLEVIVVATDNHQIADVRATAAAKAYIKEMSSRGPLALYRPDHTIAWESLR